MKVVVTGGTGFVGRQVVRQLVEAGHRPTLLVRDPAHPRVQELVRRWSVECCRGALPAEGQPLDLARADAVIHLVGIISEIGAQTFSRLHRDATRSMLEAAQRAGISRFVHMSALGTRPQAVSRYHQTKWEAEELVRASGLAWTVFRPSLIYGPGDEFVNLFARMARWSPVLPVLGGGRGLLQPVAVELVAKAFVGALTEPRSVGKVFDVCGAERLSFRDLLGLILEATGRRRVRLSIPWPLARLQAALLEFLWPRLLRRAPPLNRDQLLMLQEDNVGDPAPLREVLGLQPEPLRDGIVRFVAQS